MSDVQAVARKAYGALFQSFQTGQWEGFFEFFGPEVDVILPPRRAAASPGPRGAKLIELFSRFTPGSAHFDEVEIISKTVGADRVVFENWGKGEVFGEPYEARHCIHIIVGAPQ